MITEESFNKYLEDIQILFQEIATANKLKVDNFLKSKEQDYRKKISERIAQELALVNDCRRIGDDVGASHHLALSDVYKSLFENQTR